MERSEMDEAQKPVEGGEQMPPPKPKRKHLQTGRNVRQQEWVLCAMVLDRALLYFYTLALFVACLFIFFQSG